MSTDHNDEIAIRRVIDTPDDDDTIDTPPTRVEIAKAKFAVKQQLQKLNAEITRPIRSDADLFTVWQALLSRHILEVASAPELDDKKLRTIATLLKDLTAETRLWRDLAHRETDIKALWDEMKILKRQLGREED